MTTTLHKLNTLRHSFAKLRKSLQRLYLVVPRFCEFITIFLIHPSPTLSLNIRLPHSIPSYISPLPSPPVPADEEAATSYAMRTPVTFAREKWAAIFAQYNRDTARLKELTRERGEIRRKWIHSSEANFEGGGEVVNALAQTRQDIVDARRKIRGLKNVMGWIHGTMVTEVDRDGGETEADGGVMVIEADK